MKHFTLLYALLFALSTGTLLSKTKEDVKDLNPDELEKMMYNWTGTFTEVMELVKTKHYKPNYIEEAYTKGMDTYLNTLDPHSGLLDPKTYKLMLESTSGEFFGIGVIIDNTRKSKDKILVIVDTIIDGPADKEGIKPLDKIVEIDNVPIDGMATEEVISKIKGKRHEKVNLRVLREGQTEPLSFDIARDTVKEQNSLSFEIRDQNIYYISLNMFTQNAIKQVESLLTKAKDTSYRGVILDLRNNSGGLLNAVVEIAGLFIEKGKLVVTTKDKHDTETDRYITKRNPVANGNIPIFIITNNYTASAAEILAGCLRVHSSAKDDTKTKEHRPLVFIVGTRTFGKGSVQEVIPISNDCAAKVTTSLYYLPDGETIQGTGIEPDLIVERATPPTEQMQWFAKHYGKEEALENYIKTAKSKEKEAEQKKKDEEEKEKKKKNEPTRWVERAKEMLQTDNQLRMTISYINLLETFRTLSPEKGNDRDACVEFMLKNVATSNNLDIIEIKV